MMKILSLHEYQQWIEYLDRSAGYDFYHHPRFHSLAETQGNGRAVLCVYEEDDYFVAFPLLLRNLDNVRGLEQIGRGYWDASSVYGYVGPLTSHEELPVEIIESFQRELVYTLQSYNVVAIFSRLHPLLRNDQCLMGLGERVLLGETISLDLTWSQEEICSGYSKGHRRGIKRALTEGLSCVYDEQLDYLEEFTEIYQETMRRVGADPAYLYDHSYFQRLIESLEGCMKLFVCCKNGKAVCGGLYSLVNGIVQAHLGGVRTSALPLSPSKLEMHTVGEWAKAEGAKVFHLGGGVGAQADSLFEFKAGFSDQRHPFYVWQSVLEPKIYRLMCKMRTVWYRGADLKPIPMSYFPAYRAPLQEVDGERPESRQMS